VRPVERAVEATRECAQTRFAALIRASSVPATPCLGESGLLLDAVNAVWGAKDNRAHRPI